jgi:glycosyltransferase involved in cell wall biosynthesis
VAAFAGHKDYPTFLKAASLVLAERKDVKFIAVGKGDLLEKMKILAEELNINNDLIFTGFRQDVGVFLKSFDIFVISSKKEGLGTSVLDALAVGLPVIGTDAGGIPEMIDDGVNGLLVPAQNPVLLADAISNLLDDEYRRKAFMSFGAESIKTFGIEETVQKNIELYSRLLNA